MSTVPRGTRVARLSVRVPVALKARVRDTVDELQGRALRTSESELVEMLVAEGVACDPKDLEARMRYWRTN